MNIISNRKSIAIAPTFLHCGSLTYKIKAAQIKILCSN